MPIKYKNSPAHNHLFRSNRLHWLLIAAYVITIYSTLPLMRPALNLAYKYAGKDILSLIVNLLLVISIILVLFILLKKFYRDYLILCCAIFILSAGLYLATGYDRPEERLHYIEYALLGYLLFQASCSDFRSPSLFSIFMVALIGCGDESIQWFLPNRVGDLRDVMMNLTGGLIGIAIGRLSISAGK